MTWVVEHRTRRGDRLFWNGRTAIQGGASVAEYGPSAEAGRFESEQEALEAYFHDGKHPDPGNCCQVVEVLE